METELIDFSDTEPKLDYTLKPKETEYEMPLGIYIEEYKINTGIGIFTENFFKSFSELGRVKVARLERKSSKRGSRQDGMEKEQRRLAQAKPGLFLSQNQTLGEIQNSIIK